MRRTSLISVTITLILAIVGMADAALGHAWDLLVLFGVIAIVQAITLAVTASNRVAVTIRPDLARWATQRSQRTGEPVEDVVDRAVARYQQGLYQVDPLDVGS